MVGDDSEPPEEQVQIRVVAVAEERLRVGDEDVRIEVGEHLQLVRTTDARDHGLHVGVGERGVDVFRPLQRRRLRHPGRRVLDRAQLELLAKPPETKLERRWEPRRRPPGRREHSHRVSRRRLRRYIKVGGISRIFLRRTRGRLGTQRLETTTPKSLAPVDHSRRRQSLAGSASRTCTTIAVAAGVQIACSIHTFGSQ